MTPASPYAAATFPPLGAKQEARFQCRVTAVVDDHVTHNEQAIAARTGLTLNQIREIAVRSALGTPNSVEQFVNELLPEWLEGRNNATLRAASRA